jgi:anti-sigma regulatory factor (Ser/Thr protein kinase)
MPPAGKVPPTDQASLPAAVAAAPAAAGMGSSRTVRVPWRASALPGIRRVIVDDLRARDLAPELVDEAEMVVSELVANAVRHARALPDGTVRVHWKVKGPVVEIDVTDGGGDTTARPAPRSTWAHAGRGLRIVRSLAHEWGVQEERDGHTVWVALGGPSRRRVT